jgi:hypothetical protein
MSEQSVDDANRYSIELQEAARAAHSGLNEKR